MFLSTYMRHLLHLKLLAIFSEKHQKNSVQYTERFSKTKQAGRVKREDTEARNRQMRNEERDKLWWKDSREKRDRSDG